MLKTITIIVVVLIAALLVYAATGTSARMRFETKKCSEAASRRKQKMKIERITIDPDPYEPFHLAQGYRAGDFLFISGQAAIDASGQIVGVGDFDAQAHQVFENLDRVLRAGGSSLKNVIKVTIFLIDMSNFDKVVELRGKWLRRPIPPTRSSR